MYLKAVSGVYVETLGVIDLTLNALLKSNDKDLNEFIEKLMKYKIWGHYKRCSNRYVDRTVAESKLIYSFEEFVDFIKKKIMDLNYVINSNKELTLSKDVRIRKEQAGALIFTREYETVYYVDDELYEILMMINKSPQPAGELLKYIGREFLLKMLLTGIVVPVE